MRDVDRREFLRGVAASAAPLVAPFATTWKGRGFHAGGVVSSAPGLVGEAIPEFTVPCAMAGYLAAIVANYAVSEAVRTITMTVRLP